MLRRPELGRRGKDLLPRNLGVDADGSTDGLDRLVRTTEELDRPSRSGRSAPPYQPSPAFPNVSRHLKRAGVQPNVWKPPCLDPKPTKSRPFCSFILIKAVFGKILPVHRSIRVSRRHHGWSFFRSRWRDGTKIALFLAFFAFWCRRDTVQNRNR
jgi:hypothetical protein